jgi:hypothetical protein
MDKPRASFRLVFGEILCILIGIVILLRQRIEAMTRVVPKLKMKAYENLKSRRSP